MLELLDEIQTIARNGLAYCENPYDRERYQRLLDIAVAGYADVLKVPSEEVRARFAAELGYITPKVGASAAVVRDDGQVLLVRRSDDGTWCLPGGWLDPNESPEEAAVREAWEEAGIRVRATALVGVFTRRANAGHGPHSAVGIVYRCELLEDSIGLSHEVTELRYWNVDEVPAWHELHEEYARAAVRSLVTGH